MFWFQGSALHFAPFAPFAPLSTPFPSNITLTKAKFRPFNSSRALPWPMSAFTGSPQWLDATQLLVLAISSSILHIRQRISFIGFLEAWHGIDPYLQYSAA